MTHPSKPFQKTWGKITEPRIGVGLHYDASTTDQSAIAWFTDPRCHVSYNFIVMDSGNIIPIAPLGERAWHMGVCKSSDRRLVYRDANSAFYGISIAATAGEVATVEAKRSVVALCLSLFGDHAWPITEVWRIVSHRQHAWPRGRKNDPEGPNLARPVMNTNEIRGMVAARQIAA